MAAPDDYPPPISFLEKADLVPALLQIVGAALYAAITGPFRGDWGNKKYRSHVGYAAFRKMEARLSLAQGHYMNPSTAQVYAAACKAQNITPESFDLPNGTKGHWIGKKDAKHVMVYYHGGGFCLPIQPAYLEFIIPTVKELNKAGKDFSILVLSYTLAPIRQYPTQLEQCVELLRYVLHDMGRNPSSVMIGGDSAGGNLTLGVLSHLSHPHPSIKPLELSEPLMGVLLISPWVCFDTNKPAVKENEYKDCISPLVAPRWSGAYLGSTPSDNYTEAVNAPADWWKGLKAKEILIVGGSDEILIDSIREIARNIESVHPSTTVVIANGETHDQALLGPAIGDKGPTEQGDAIKSWFTARL